MKGYKHTEFGWIPEDWEVNNFGSVCSKIIDGTHFSPKSKSGTFKYLTSKNVRNEGLDLTDVNFISESEHKDIYKRCPVKYGDILLTKDGASTGACCLNTLDEEFSLLSSVAVLRSDEKKLYNQFFYQFIKSSLGQAIISNSISGQAITRITLEKLRGFSVCIPKLPEQKIIANILTDWDRVIRTTTQLLYAKQQLKKGLMQQLLTGKKRLSGFKEKWKHIHLGSIGETYTGLTGKTSEDFGMGKPFIPYMNIFSNSRVDVSFVEFVKIDKKESQNKVEYGDIFFTVSSETPEEVGMASVLLDQIDEMYLNSFCFGFRLKNLDTLLPEFARFYMRSGLIKKELYKLAQGSTRFNLSKNELMKVHLFIPSDIKEQKCIAEVLSKAENEIKILESQFNFYKEQKKGLMQQLLTGKKRVKV